MATTSSAARTVTKCMGGVRLADGTLAGSVLSMDQALRNLVNTLGLSLAEASSRVSTFAADYMDLRDRGRLQPGAWADAVVLHRDLQVQAVWVEGGVLQSRSCSRSCYERLRALVDISLASPTRGDAPHRCFPDVAFDFHWALAQGFADDLFSTLPSAACVPRPGLC